MKFQTGILLLAWLPVLHAQPAVTISAGKISGKDLGDVQEWLGIPYAAPPVGDLRWSPPQPPASWTGVRAMDHYGAVCMQPQLSGLLNRLQGQSMSEDCLTLNIWAPKHADKAAVMFWIHGGAFVQGSGSMAIYAGTSLAKQGVVVVTINYRLGDFGFFANPQLKKDAEGNFALMDQVAALEWVHRNIAAFGGDPGNVIIFGESAGGSSVNYLMISPMARGLFQKAIAESGGGQMRAGDLATLEATDSRKAQEWGATDLKSLRALPAQTILSKLGRVGLAQYSPVADGKYVPEGPGQAFAGGKQAPVPFLLGANSFEASLMSMFPVGDNLMARAGTRAKQYYGDDPKKASQDLFTDAVFLGPARRLAGDMEQVHKPAYLYFFSYVLERRRAESPGASHGSEIPFVFDQFPTILGAAVTADDRKMAATMSSYWVQFAKTGNPNRPGLPEWPAYAASTDRLLEFGTDIAVRTHFRAERLDLLARLMRQ